MNVSLLRKVQCQSVNIFFVKNEKIDFMMRNSELGMALALKQKISIRSTSSSAVHLQYPLSVTRHRTVAIDNDVPALKTTSGSRCDII